MKFAAVSVSTALLFLSLVALSPVAVAGSFILLGYTVTL